MGEMDGWAFIIIAALLFDIYTNTLLTIRENESAFPSARALRAPKYYVRGKVAMPMRLIAAGDSITMEPAPECDQHTLMVRK